MKRIKSKFNSEQVAILESIGIFLSDEIDYAVDELIEFHDKITAFYTSECFNDNGEATEKAKLLESIIDLFYDEFDI